MEKYLPPEMFDASPNQKFQYQAKLVLVLTDLVLDLVLKSWSKPVFGFGFGIDFKIYLKTGKPTISNCQIHFHPQVTFSENMYNVMECIFAQFQTINAKQWQLTKPNSEELLHREWCGKWGKINTRLFGHKRLVLTFQQSYDMGDSYVSICTTKTDADRAKTLHITLNIEVFVQ